ncbi:prephenate dehydratase domain-containing protein, partial [Corynebacterium heidelbergense]
MHVEPATTVAYLGPRGTFTEQALQEFVAAGQVPADARLVPVDSPGAALQAVRRGEAQLACVALENSVDGPVSQTFDALAQAMWEPEAGGLRIIRERDVPVEFSIVVRPGTRREDVRTFVTHPVAMAQVRSWLSAELPGVPFVAATSNG